MPKWSQILRVTGFTGTASSWISAPTPAIWHISQIAPNMPPSVTSCIPWVPTEPATVPSRTTLTLSSSALAPSISSLESTPLSSDSKSPAIMPVPSRPAVFVIMMESPIRMFSAEAETPRNPFPIAVDTITGLFTAVVTSV